MLLGIQPFETMPEVCAGCKKDIKHDFYHFLNCIRSLGVFATGRHNVIRDLLHRWALKAFITSQKEPYYLNMNNDSRVDLKWMICDQMTLIDVAVTNTTASSYVHLDPIDVMHNRAAAKHKHHESTAVGLGAIFKPFIITTFGAMDKNAKYIINMLRTNAHRCSIPQSVNNFILELTSAIAIAVQVGNSQLLSMGYMRSTTSTSQLYIQPSSHTSPLSLANSLAPSKKRKATTRKTRSMKIRILNEMGKKRIG